MGSIMRSAVNQGSISRDRLSLPETIYWIPRSKWAFLLFSSVFGELFRGSARPLGACGAPLFPSFTHENSFLSLPTSASLLPQCLPKVSPHCSIATQNPPAGSSYGIREGVLDFICRFLEGDREGVGEGSGTYLKKLNSCKGMRLKSG